MKASVQRPPPSLYSDKRLRELADGSWIKPFRKQYPLAITLQAGAENVHLTDAIDMHVHADPCMLATRSQDFTDVAISSARAGLRAVVRKDHFQSTVGEAYAIQRHIDDLVARGDLPHRIEVYGGIPVGSLDIVPMERALRFSTFKMIWLNSVNGERLIDDGRVRPEAERIIALAAEHRRGLNVGAPNHSAQQYLGVGDYEGVGSRRWRRSKSLGALAVLDHPLSSLTIDEIAKLVGDGVYAGVGLPSFFYERGQGGGGPSDSNNRPGPAYWRSALHHRQRRGDGPRAHPAGGPATNDTSVAGGRNQRWRH